LGLQWLFSELVRRQIVEQRRKFRHAEQAQVDRRRGALCYWAFRAVARHDNLPSFDDAFAKGERYSG
jgi:hypothetical protein